MAEPYTPDGSKVTYTVPSLDDPADGPQAFRDFADSIPPGLSAAIPIRVKNEDYTLALDDEGAGVFFDTTTESHKVTVPTHAEIAFPVGTAIVIGNVGTNKEGNVQITPADGVTVRDTAVRKVGLNRMAVLLQVEQDSWIINAGTGGGPGPGSVPSPPKLVGAFGGPECVYLNWDAPKDDGGHDLTTYTVEKSTDGTDWVLCATELPTVLSVRVDGLTTGTKYQFRVKAGNVVGLSDPSNVLEATPTNAYNDAAGGTITTYSKDGKRYRRHTFTTTGTFSVKKAATPFFVVAVGAGGSGGGGFIGRTGGSGGGAGAFEKLMTLEVGDVPVKVGVGGGVRQWNEGGFPGTSTSVGTATAGFGGGGANGQYIQDGGATGGAGGPGTEGTASNGGTGGANQPATFPGQAIRDKHSLGSYGKGGGPGGQDQQPSEAGSAGIAFVEYEIAPSNEAEGGSISEYTKDGKRYRVHTFTAAGTFKVTSSVDKFRALIMGAGGRSGGGAGGKGGEWKDLGQIDLGVGPYAVTVASGGGNGRDATGQTSFNGQTVQNATQGPDGGGFSSDITGVPVWYCEGGANCGGGFDTPGHNPPHSAGGESGKSAGGDGYGCGQGGGARTLGSGGGGANGVCAGGPSASGAVIISYEVAMPTKDLGPAVFGKNGTAYNPVTDKFEAGEA